MCIRDRPDVTTQLQGLLDKGDKVSMLAVDGDVINDVEGQLRNLPNNTTHLVISIGGNDTLAILAEFSRTTKNIGDSFLKLHDLRDSFESDYIKMLTNALSFKLPTTLCTIYHPCFNHSETDGYRDENEQQQNNLISELRYPGKNGDHFITISFSEQIMSTPSDRSQDQLFTDRRGSDTPDDYINSEGGAILYSTDYKLSDYMTFILNSSFRLKDSFSDLQSTNYPSYNETSLLNYQFTPRINYLSNFLGQNITKIVRKSGENSQNSKIG